MQMTEAKPLQKSKDLLNAKAAVEASKIRLAAELRKVEQAEERAEKAEKAEKAKAEAASRKGTIDPY